MVRQSSTAPLLPEQSPQKITTTVKLSEVFSAGLRLEAAAFNIDARAAVQELYASELQLSPVLGEAGLCQKVNEVTRFGRRYVKPEHGVPFLSSSDIISLKPEINKYLSRKLTKQLDQLLISEWDILISRSGTVGNVSLAGRNISGMALSEHALRLQSDAKETAGYVTAFLRSRYGRLQLTNAS